MNTHKKVIAFTRCVVALLFIVAIWGAPGMISNIAATIGTIIWLFMPNVVRAEEVILKKVLAEIAKDDDNE